MGCHARRTRFIVHKLSYTRKLVVIYDDVDLIKYYLKKRKLEYSRDRFSVLLKEKKLELIYTRLICIWTDFLSMIILTVQMKWTLHIISYFNCICSAVLELPWRPTQSQDDAKIDENSTAKELMSSPKMIKSFKLPENEPVTVNYLKAPLVGGLMEVKFIKNESGLPPTC